MVKSKSSLDASRKNRNKEHMRHSILSPNTLFNKIFFEKMILVEICRLHLGK